ncbi:MAG: mechanosensitive ion channel protein, partial [Erythrobacter sp.]|nr:mechanosensitive ion channel protein [Erythrobacter sp.]
MSRPAPPRNVVSGSEGAIEELASQNTTIAAIVEELDSWALAVGSWRISAFDVLFGLVAVLLLLTAAWLATRLTHAALRRLTALDGTQRVLAEKIVTIVIWVVTFFLGVDLLGIDLTALAVFSGAFGLAIGFGLQKTFGNLIS